MYTSPLWRTARWRAGPALSEKTIAQKPGGRLIDWSQPPEADVVADLRPPQASVVAAAMKSRNVRCMADRSSCRKCAASAAPGPARSRRPSLSLNRTRIKEPDDFKEPDTLERPRTRS